MLVGGGDPSLNSDTLFELARMLKDAGVQEVTGKFRVYDKALPRLDEIDPKQPVQVGYNPGLSGLNLNYNRVYFEWRRSGNGHSVTMDARTSRLRPRVDVIGMSVAGRDLPVYTYKSRAKKEEWTVARSALGKEGGPMAARPQTGSLCSRCLSHPGAFAWYRSKAAGICKHRTQGNGAGDAIQFKAQ